MAKMIAKMGKVTFTSSNGEVIEFEPNQVTYNQQVPEKYWSWGDTKGNSVSSGLVDITIEGTYYPEKYYNGYVMSGSACSISAANFDIKYGYKSTIGECSKMRLNMNWLKPDQLQNTDLAPGMLFLYENRSSIFGNEEEVVNNLTVMVINGAVPCAIDLSEYAGGLLVTGFDVPKASHPIINTLLKPAIHHRGTVAQNNPRTIYEYMSNETYGLGLYVGLTVHDVLGSWSSWPVHEYEINALTAPIGLYPDFSEKFAFITQPMGNWGLQARSQANGEKSVLKFRDNDIIDIPLGAHPSVAGPATRLAYFWAYTGAPRKDF